jgi:hypothetical protein
MAPPLTAGCLIGIPLSSAGGVRARRASADAASRQRSNFNSMRRDADDRHLASV